MAQLFKPADIESNVVVYEEDSPGSAVAGIADITEHPFKRVRVKVAAPHFDDRTETAVIRAATRSLDHIHLAAQQGVALEYPSTTIRRANLIIFQAMHRPQDYGANGCLRDATGHKYFRSLRPSLMPVEVREM